MVLLLIGNVLAWVVAPFFASGRDQVVSEESVRALVHELSESKVHPDVVMVGSSVIRCPMEYLFKVTPDHQVAFEFAGASGRKQQLVNLSIRGQIASDSYVLVNECVKGTKVPKYLVIGVIPRDFLDTHLPAETATFLAMTDWGSMWKYQALFKPSPIQFIQSVFHRTLFLVARRQRIVLLCETQLSRLYKCLGICPSENDFLESRQAGKLEEFKDRYTNISVPRLSQQLNFLQRTLIVCQQRGIKVILVNMPLRQDTLSLLPAGFSDNLSGEFRKIATRSGAEFLDLSDSAAFTEQDFSDATHLNKAGAQRFWAVILGRLD